jgi:dipeptidase
MENSRYLQKNRHMKSSLFWFFNIFLLSQFLPNLTNACTNYILSRGSTKDGSVMITYAADSHTRYGAVAFFPAADHKPEDLCKVFHYESGKYMGSIPEIPHTCSVVQFMNEYQVAIGETTFGGLEILASQPGAILDYGSLMRIALQRSKTAREAISVMADLVSRFGYASGGESFSISDSKEAWIMEMIGKGQFEVGAVWVARCIPDGYISGHANQARITRFPFQKSNNWNDPAQQIFHSPDVISFARSHGFFRGDDKDFSFSDVYNPVGFGGARFCDARIWTFFRKINRDFRENKSYTNYITGNFERSESYPDGTANPSGFVTNRLPLWIKPDSLVSLKEVMAAMRDHYEDTELDMRFDLGAGPYACPYRWRPMEFTVDGVKYLHERAVATQQTGYSFIAQSRSWLPDPCGGIFWFGVDDADGCVYTPLFCGITSVPESYRTGNGSMIRWSDSSAYWTFSQLNNFAYSRYNVVHPEIESYQNQLENNFIKEIARLDSVTPSLLRNDPEGAIRLITEFSVVTGNRLVRDWKSLYHYLFMKYMDGNAKYSDGHQLVENGFGKEVPKKPTHPGYGPEWERRMVEGTGDRLKVHETK